MNSCTRRVASAPPWSSNTLTLVGGAIVIVAIIIQTRAASLPEPAEKRGSCHRTEEKPLPGVAEIPPRVEERARQDSNLWPSVP